MKSKKASIGSRTAMYSIVILIFGVVTIMFSDKLFGWRAAETPNDICKASVQEAASSEFLGTELITELRCPTEQKTWTETDKEVLKQKLANEMYNCYDKFGQGKQALFSGPTAENFCVICSIITFKETNLVLPSHEFRSYLHDTPISPGSKTSYEAFLSGYTTNPSVMDEYKGKIDSQSFNIVTNKQYTVIFNYVRKGYYGKTINTLAGIGIGAATGIGIVVLAPFTGGGSVVLGLAALGGGAAGGFLGYQAGSSVSQDWDSSVVLLPYDSKYLKSIGCSQLPASQQPTDIIKDVKK